MTEKTPPPTEKPKKVRLQPTTMIGYILTYYRLAWEERRPWLFALLGANLSFGALMGAIVVYGRQAIAIFQEMERGEFHEEKVQVFVTLVGLGVCVFPTMFLSGWLDGFFPWRLLIDIRNRLCEKLLTLPLSFFESRKSGDLISRMNNDLSNAQITLNQLFGPAVQYPFTLFFSIAACFYINWFLACFCFILLPIVAAIFTGFGSKIRRYSKRTLIALSDVMDIFFQMLGGIRIIKIFRLEGREYDEFRKQGENQFHNASKMFKYKALSKSLVEAVGYMAMPLFLIGIFQLYQYEHLPEYFRFKLADVGAIALAMTQVYQSVRMLSKEYNALQESLAGTERIFELMRINPPREDTEGIHTLEKVRQGVEFKNVSFWYDDQGWRLNNINFKIGVGEMVALVGMTGSGKTTIADLLARFYMPQQGDILIDGMPLRDIKKESYLDQLAVVSQEAFLFNDAIRNNIAMGRPGATEEEIRAAAKAAFVEEFALAKPEGYDFTVGERGSHLSGGQRQRVTIARALIKNPGILILDEATSALDSQSEKVVQDALDKLIEGKSVLVIAHRLSTIRKATRILVLSNGQIVETGTHDELIAQNGTYAQTWRQQIGG